MTDTGCTVEAIVSTDLVEQLGATARPTTVSSPLLGDHTHRLKLIGEVTMELEFEDNKYIINAVVAEGVTDLLIEIPGLSKMGVIINCGAKTLTFPNGVVYNYRTS